MALLRKRGRLPVLKEPFLCPHAKQRIITTAEKINSHKTFEFHMMSSSSLFFCPRVWFPTLVILWLRSSTLIWHALTTSRRNNVLSTSHLDAKSQSSHKTWCQKSTILGVNSPSEQGMTGGLPNHILGEAATTKKKKLSSELKCRNDWSICTVCQLTYAKNSSGTAAALEREGERRRTLEGLHRRCFTKITAVPSV